MELLLLLVALLWTTQAYKEYTDYCVVRAVPQDEGQVRFLDELMATRPEFDFWTDGNAKDKSTDIMATRAHADKLESLLNVLQINHTPLIDNLQELVSAEREAQQTARSAALAETRAHDYTYYMEYDELLQFYTDLMTNCSLMPGGDRCDTIYIGDSYEGRRQYVYKVSNGDGRVKEKLWVDAGIHAREWISPAVGQYFTERMVYDYGVDPSVTLILNSFDFYILADVNPDGYVYSHEVERLWRMNRRPLDISETDQGCYGVDVNRNYDHHWNETGTGEPCTITYAGPAAFSEPESTNQNSIMQQLMVQDPGAPIVYFLTLHSYSQLWMTPYGFSTTNPGNLAELLRVAEAGVTALEAVNGVDYIFGEASDILGYSTSGTSRDWAAGTMNIRFVFTIELRPEDDPPGFVLPPDQIQPTVLETWAGYVASVMDILSG